MQKSVSVGTFVKTASPHVVEVLGTTGLDFVCLDAEHAPLDRAALDLLVLAARAAGMPAFIRIPAIDPAVVLNALDIGAAGIVVPHVDSARQAREVVSMARYAGGTRGYSGSPRFGGYGSLGMKEALKAGDASAVICQIESPSAVEEVQDIASTPGVAGVFVGRADLALSMGLQDSRDDRVLAATRHVIEVARAAGKLAGVFVANGKERDQFAALGANWFIASSDQGLMRSAAQQLVATA